MGIRSGVERLLYVAMIISGAAFFLVVGGATVKVAFLETLPQNSPMLPSTISKCFAGAGLGSVLAALLGLRIEEVAPDLSKLKLLSLAIWGFAASFIGWFCSMGLIMAAIGGGWTPPEGILFSGFFSSAIPTVAISAIVWILPALIIAPGVWVGKGFASKE